MIVSIVHSHGQNQFGGYGRVENPYGSSTTAENYDLCFQGLLIAMAAHRRMSRFSKPTEPGTGLLTGSTVETKWDNPHLYQ